VSGCQGQTDSRSESGQRNRPKVKIQHQLIRSQSNHRLAYFQNAGRNPEAISINRLPGRPLLG